jgi:DNA-binding NarL/FixJ family response regulator
MMGTDVAQQHLDSDLGGALGGNPPTILVADRQPVLAQTRQALEREGFAVVASAESADAAIEAATQTAPQLCVLAMDMPGGGLRAAREIHRAGLETEIAVVSDRANAFEALACIRAGANGYLPRDQSREPPAAALRAMLRGEAAVPRAFEAALAAEVRRSVAVAAETHGPINRAVFYVPRFLRHFRHRRRSGMPWGEAWHGAKMRLREYR